MKKMLLALLVFSAFCSPLSAGFSFFWHSERCHPAVVVSRPGFYCQGHYIRYHPVRRCEPLSNRVRLHRSSREVLSREGRPARESAPTSGMILVR